MPGASQCSRRLLARVLSIAARASVLAPSQCEASQVRMSAIVLPEMVKYLARFGNDLEIFDGNRAVRGARTFKNFRKVVQVCCRVWLKRAE